MDTLTEFVREVSKSLNEDVLSNTLGALILSKVNNTVEDITGFDPNLKTFPQITAEYISSNVGRTSRIAPLVEHVNEHYIQPIKGRFDPDPLVKEQNRNIALMNFLQALGEDFDTFANPVKATTISTYKVIAGKETIEKGLSNIYQATFGTQDTFPKQWDYDIRTKELWKNILNSDMPEFLNIPSGILDFITNTALEIVSDPLTFTGMISGKVVKTGSKRITKTVKEATKASPAFTAVKEEITTAVKQTLKTDFEKSLETNVAKKARALAEESIKGTDKELTESLIKAYEKEARELILKEFDDLVKQVTDNVIEQALEEAFEKTDLKNIITSKDIWEDSRKLRKNQEAKQLALNKLTTQNLTDNVLKEYEAYYTKEFVKTLSGKTSLSSAQLIELLRSDPAFKTYKDTVRDLLHAGYDNSITKHVAKLYNSAKYFDDAFTSSVLKLGLTGVGIYPLYRLFKSDVVGQFFDLRAMNRVKQISANRLINKKIESMQDMSNTVTDSLASKSSKVSARESRKLEKINNKVVEAKYYQGAMQVASKEKTLEEMYLDLVELFGPQKAAMWMQTKLAQYIENAIDIMTSNIPEDVKLQYLLNIFQSFNSYKKYDSIKDFIADLQDFQEALKTYQGSAIPITGLEKYIEVFKNIDEVTSTGLNIVNVKKLMNNVNFKTRGRIVEIINMFDTAKVFDDFKTEDIIDAITYFRNMTDAFRAIDPIKGVSKFIEFKTFWNTYSNRFFKVKRLLENIIDDKELREVLNTLLDSKNPASHYYTTLLDLDTIIKNNDRYAGLKIQDLIEIFNNDLRTLIADLLKYIDPSSALYKTLLSIDGDLLRAAFITKTLDIKTVSELFNSFEKLNEVLGRALNGMNNFGSRLNNRFTYMDYLKYFNVALYENSPEITDLTESVLQLLSKDAIENAKKALEKPQKQTRYKSKYFFGKQKNVLKDTAIATFRKNYYKDYNKYTKIIDNSKAIIEYKTPKTLVARDQKLMNSIVSSITHALEADTEDILLTMKDMPAVYEMLTSMFDEFEVFKIYSELLEYYDMLKRGYVNTSEGPATKADLMGVRAEAEKYIYDFVDNIRESKVIKTADGTETVIKEELNPFIEQCLHDLANDLIRIFRTMYSLKNASKKEQLELFKRLYARLQSDRNTLAVTYNYLKDYLNPPKGFEVIKRDFDLRKYSYRPETPTDAWKRIQTLKQDKGLGIDMYKAPSRENSYRQIYNEYTRAIKEEADSGLRMGIQKEFDAFKKYLADNEINLDDTLSKQDFMYYFPPEGLEKAALNQMLEDLIDRLDVRSIERKLSMTDSAHDLIFFKLENAKNFLQINMLEAIQRVRQDSTLMQYLKDSRNLDAESGIYKTLRERFSDEDIKALQTLDYFFNAFDQFTYLINDIQVLVTSVAKEDLPKNCDLENAILETLINYKDFTAQKLSDKFDAFFKEIVYRLEGRINGADIKIRKNDMDTLIRTLNLQPVIDVEIAKINKVRKANGEEAIQRHTALYDAIAQLIVKEQHTKGSKALGEYMLDIETTGLLSRGGGTSGNITEIAVVRRNTQGEIEVVLNESVKLPKLDISAGYIPEPSALSRMGIDQETYMKLHTAKAGEEHTQEQVLENFWDWISNLDTSATLYTFNGDNFDLIYLKKKIIELIGDRDMSGTQLRDLTPVLNRLDVQDLYQRIATDRYRTSSTVVMQLENILRRHLDRMLSLNNYTQITQHAPRFIDGIGNNFMYAMQEFFRLDDLAEIVSPQEGLDELLFAGDLLDIFNERAEDSIYAYAQSVKERLDDLDNSRATNVSEELLYAGNDSAYTKSSKEARANRILQNEIFKENIKPELRKALQDIYEQVIEQYTFIGAVNKEWSKYPVTTAMLDKNASNYDPKKVLKLQRKLVIDLQFAGYTFEPRVKAALINTPVDNFTQLTTILRDQQFIGYRKVSQAGIDNLDLTNVLLGNDDLIRLDNFNRSVSTKMQMISNRSLILETKDEVMEMLQIIKEKGLNIESQVLPIGDSNLYYNYALLETVYNKLVGMANGQGLRQPDAKELLDQLNKEYGNVIHMLDTGSPMMRVNNNSSKMYIEYPDYVKANYDEYFEDMAIKDMIDSSTEKAIAIRDTMEYKVSAAEASVSIGESLKNLVAFRETFFDAKGQPTEAYMKLKKSGRDMHKIYAAWEMNQIMKLSAEDLLAEVVYSNNNHVKVLLMPTSGYFNNRELFLQMATRKKELEQVGLKMKLDKDTEGIILHLDPELKVTRSKNKHTRAYYCVNGKDIEAPVLQELSKEELLKTMGLAGKDINYTDDGVSRYLELLHRTRSASLATVPEYSGRLGVTNSREHYFSARDNLLFKDLSHITEFEDNYMPYFYRDFAGDLDNIYSNSTTPFNLDAYHSVVSLAQKAMYHENKYIEYGQFIMSGGLRLDNPAIAKHMTDQDIINLLNANPSLSLVYLKDNPKTVGGYEIARVRHFTPKTIAKARELNATIIPEELYRTSAGHINQFRINNPIFAIWHQIIKQYKRGFLIAVGVPMRNAIDSTMKTFGETKDFSGTMWEFVKSFNVIDKYTKILKDIINMDSNEIKYLRLENIDKYFRINKNKKLLLAKEEFMMIYDFMEHSGINTISRGNIKLTDLLKHPLTGITQVPTTIFNTVMKPMSFIERINRFTMFRTLNNNNVNYSEIIRKINLTHFDYNNKTYEQFLLENIIPFYSFIASNINYLVHLIEENPVLLKTYFNAYTPIWDFDGYNYEELSENISLQNQIINGNIPLEKLFGIQDKETTTMANTKYGPKEMSRTNNATIRMGSSILDALRFFINPYQNIKEKLAPPAQVTINTIENGIRGVMGVHSEDSYQSLSDAQKEYHQSFAGTTIQDLFTNRDDLISIIPYAGIAKQRLDASRSNMKKSGNDLYAMFPSVFGVTSRYGEFTNKSKKEHPTYVYPKKQYSGKGYSKSYSKKGYSKSYSRYRKTYPRKQYKPTSKPKNLYGKTYNTMYGKMKYYEGPRPYVKTYSSGKVPYSTYSNFIFDATHPNYRNTHPNRYHNPTFQSVPQYLHSYNGLNSRGKSKLLSWARMSPYFKVKTTTKRLARSRSPYAHF